MTRLQPGVGSDRWSAGLVLVMLVASALMLAVCGDAVDGTYDWRRHTTSEAAGQGVRGAWVARTGFLLFGVAVLTLTSGRARPWKRLPTLAHTVFGLCFLAVAAFSARSWDRTVPYDPTEDTLHSVGATLMGFAFAFGVATVAADRVEDNARPQPLDFIAVAASVAIPLGMIRYESSAGLLQRLMFLVAYVWFAREAWSALVDPTRRRQEAVATNESVVAP